MLNLKPEKKLGFGLMRLPLDENKEIDIPQVCKMVDAFLAKGFTYFDTAYVYHSGKSECVAKEALVKRHPRESFTLATKLPAWEIKCQEDVRRIFDEQLERTGAGYFDHYLLHAIGSDNIATYDQYDCWSFGLKMKEEGLVRFFGFSFHDSAEMLDDLLTKHPYVDFVQLQINYLDWDDANVQSRACYEVATRHNVPVVVMEPVKGGNLASMPEYASGILKAAKPDASPAAWALRYVASLENVMCVLSGMSDEAQMADNVNTMADFQPMTEDEYAVIARTVEAIHSVETVPCTGCRYCVDGCPMGILIPDLIKCLNDARVYGKNSRNAGRYDRFASEGAPASACVQCGQCEGACPQHLPVIEILQEAASVFEG